MAAAQLQQILEQLHQQDHQIQQLDQRLRLEIQQWDQQLRQHIQQLDQQIQEQSQQIQQQNQQIQQQNQQVQQLNQQVGQLQVSQNLLPMRLQNSSSSLSGMLVYPPGLDMPDVAPVTKLQLLQLDVPACEQTAQALGLPPLPDAPLIARRQQIIDFLGAGMTAH